MPVPSIPALPDSVLASCSRPPHLGLCFPSLFRRAHYSWQTLCRDSPVHLRTPIRRLGHSSLCLLPVLAKHTCIQCIPLFQRRRRRRHAANAVRRCSTCLAVLHARHRCGKFTSAPVLHLVAQLLSCPVSLALASFPLRLYCLPVSMCVTVTSRSRLASCLFSALIFF